MGYSFQLAARVLLYAPSHRQGSTYHSLCYTSRGALARTRNSSMGPPWRINPTTHHTMSRYLFLLLIMETGANANLNLISSYKNKQKHSFGMKHLAGSYWVRILVPAPTHSMILEPWNSFEVRAQNITSEHSYFFQWRYFFKQNWGFPLSLSSVPWITEMFSKNSQNT